MYSLSFWQQDGDCQGIIILSTNKAGEKLVFCVTAAPHLYVKILAARAMRRSMLLGDSLVQYLTADRMVEIQD
jgi:hypothetical protein